MVTELRVCCRRHGAIVYMGVHVVYETYEKAKFETDADKVSRTFRACRL